MMASAASPGDHEVLLEAGGKKGADAAAASGATAAVRPPEHGLKCPRCDSPNTKFCYYNNYSLSQPRYFCKTCRRYWTKGGALRNVPVGGGCRKSKKSKPSSSSARLSSDVGPAHQELRFYQLGLPPAPAVVNLFHPPGSGGPPGLPFSRLLHRHHPGGVFAGAAATDGAAAVNPLISFGDLSCSAADLPAEAAAGATAAPLLGFSYPMQAAAPPQTLADMGVRGGGEATNDTPGTNLAAMHSNLAVSIESLSSINQGLHWKLQQQRLAMFFGGGDQSQQQQHHAGKGDSATAPLPAALLEAQTPATTAGVVSRKGSLVGDVAGSTTEWFLDNSGTAYGAATSGGHITLNNSSGSNAGGGNWNGGVQAWHDMHQFSALP